MKAKNNGAPTILVVADVEETRDGIEVLLERDGYHVEAARDGEDAIRHAQFDLPRLILLSLGTCLTKALSLAHHIRDDARLDKNLPVVIFCVEEIEQGEEVVVDSNIYLTRPDNFNQLRGLIGQLLREQSNAA